MVATIEEVKSCLDGSVDGLASELRETNATVRFLEKVKGVHKFKWISLTEVTDRYGKTQSWRMRNTSPTTRSVTCWSDMALL